MAGKKNLDGKSLKSFDISSLGKADKYGRIFLANNKKHIHFPELLEMPKKGFNEFINKYLNKIFEDINPIEDIGGEDMSVMITNISVGQPMNTIEECKHKELTYGAMINGKVTLKDKKSKKTLFSKQANIGILPLMTSQATYIINGVARIVISQLMRSYGIFFSKKDFRYVFKLIPEAGSRLEVSIEKSGNVVARINKSRKFSITALLRIFGLETDESIWEIFTKAFDDEDTNYLEYAFKKDPTTDALSAAEYIYSKLRPGELIDAENALDYIKGMFLSHTRMNLGGTARRKINAKLQVEKSLEHPDSNLFDAEDLIAAMKYLFRLANEHRNYYFDDPDHLANKRVRTMGEILYSHLQPVMRKFAKSVKGKLSILNTEEQIKLNNVVNFKIIDNSIKSFFATSQLSQFLDQINPLAEIDHKRRLTALGPGGLQRQTAKFDVRDLHSSHYGRICPVETPEGQNIGLVLYQSLYSNLNDEGFLESPAAVLIHEVKPIADLLVNRISRKTLYVLNAQGEETEKVLIKEDSYIDAATAKKIAIQYGKIKKLIKIQPYFTDDIEYISPELDERYYVADVTTDVDKYNNLLHKRIAGRHFGEMKLFHTNDLTHIDINPAQLFGPNAALIPFIDHNDSVRAMVATNQHRQGVPLLRSESPLVGTGLEGDVLSMTHAVIKAEGDGEIIYVDGKRIKVKYKDKKSGTKEYELLNFKKSNQKTTLHQKPLVSLGQKIKKGELLAEGPCADKGEFAVGANLKVAFMPWDGYNFEDAIVISKRLVQDDAFTSIHIISHELEVSETKLGHEETTNDIPGVNMKKLSQLDADGIIRIGSVVKGGSILIGKITPKGEGDLSPEEKLIQAIFGDKSKSVKDTSLYLPSGSGGKVIQVEILDAKKGDNVSAGVLQKIKVYIASTRKIEIGDKLAAKHGNKGIISIVVPEEDMPYTKDGTSIDVVLNPLGVISRMNLGQLFETQIGLIAKTLGVKFAVPTFSGFGVNDIKKIAKKIGLPENLKMNVYDGRTGEKYLNPVTVGYMQIMKLNHMVEDKIHARSVGPYSLITQQPLGGKARNGGQRFGEMEVRALEAYSAVYTLQEMLTIKSDDVFGRNKTYDAIIKGEKLKVFGLPESFNYLLFLMKGLCQNVKPIDKQQIDQIHKERIKKIMSLGLSSVSNTNSGDDADAEDIVSKEDILSQVIQDMEESGEIDDN